MILLKPGMVFCTENPQALGKAICEVEASRNLCLNAEYSHAGIILDSTGATFEAVWHIERQNIFKAYAGSKVLIAEWDYMTPQAFQRGWDAVKDEEGMIYPYWRLALHLLGLAKWIHLGKDTVCSELAEKFLINAGAVTLGGKNWWGAAPDELASEWKISRYFDIVYEGVL